MRFFPLLLLLTGCFIGGDPFVEAAPDAAATLSDAAALEAPPRIAIHLRERADASAPDLLDASPEAAPDPGCLSFWERPCLTDAGLAGCAPYGDVNPSDCHEKVSSDR